MQAHRHGGPARRPEAALGGGDVPLRGPRRGIVVTSGRFTEPARTYAASLEDSGDPHPIALIDGRARRAIAAEVGLDLRNGRIGILDAPMLAPPAPGPIAARVDAATVERIDLEVSVDREHVDDPEALTLLHHPADGSPAVRPSVTAVTEEAGQVTVRGSVGSLGVVRLVAATERPPAVTEPAGQTPSEQMETPPPETATPTPSTDRPIPGFTMTVAVLSLLLTLGLLRLR